MTEYVHVGHHADVLASGRPLGPGERITHDDLDLEPDEEKGLRGEDRHLIDEGRLVDLASFEGANAGDVLTGDALKARAAELNIQGRSIMNAEELRSAIVEHDQGEASDAA